MGCVSSNLLNQDEELSQLGSSALGHHIVSLTSTTYGLLTLDPPSNPPPRFTLASLFPSEPKPEVINSWELMSGLDTESFRFSPKLHFPTLCPPNGENRVVIHTTSLRGVRKTFEACNAVRAAFEALGLLVCERDVSMHSAFREELRVLLKGKQREAMLPPRVFVKGLYIGGADEMLKVAEEGLLGELLQGLPRKKVGAVCHGCGDMRFLPCSHCNGSCKTVLLVPRKQGRTLVVKCSHCNENGLVLCPVCR
uniref:Uncharacterized protein At5g39865 family n=2 Tax=Cajanus cajan TaxID=3821 RepID=A0A151TK99_CAJCA|nr:Uncharacterized protein At5g39865 family [Cajanus cajan]